MPSAVELSGTNEGGKVLRENRILFYLNWMILSFDSARYMFGGLLNAETTKALQFSLLTAQDGSIQITNNRENQRTKTIPRNDHEMRGVEGERRLH